MATKTKLGGGSARAVQRRYVQPTTGFGTGDVGNIAKGINNLVQDVGKVLIRKKEKKNEEDAIQLLHRAKIDSIDGDNAMDYASQNEDLNKMVKDMRESGHNDTKIRETVWKYQEGLAITEFDLDKGEFSDEAELGYFTSLNKLSIDSISPLAKKDRASMQKDKANTINSAFMVSTDNIQKVYDNSKVMGASYDMSEEQVGLQAIKASFSRAKRGDDSYLEELKTLKDSKGNLIINSVEGSKLYDQLSTMKTEREYQQGVRAQQDEFKSQDKMADTIYTLGISDKDGDVETAYMLLEDSIETGKIRVEQHRKLKKILDLGLPSEAGNFAKESEPTTYINLMSQAKLGTLKVDTLVDYTGVLSAEDFKSITKTQLDKGGYAGIGNAPYKNLMNRVENFSKSNSGVPIDVSVLDSISGQKTVFDRQVYMETQLNKYISNYINTSEKLPDDDTVSKWEDKILKEADRRYGVIDEGGVAQTVPFKSTDTNPESIIDFVNSGVPAEQLKKLSDIQFEIYLNRLKETENKKKE